MSVTHDLKTWPQFFAQVFGGYKKFEVRRDDRGYLPGDRLHLREWCPERSAYTGRAVTVHVTHLLRGGRFGIESGFVVMSITLNMPGAAGLGVA